MSSTEPPSRNLPRNQPQDTKTAREELSSKGKVEKVREIDADEQARKRKFLKFYKDDLHNEDKAKAENHPSPFDLCSGKTLESEGKQGNLGSSSNQDTAPFSAPYTPPPDIQSFQGEDEEAENQATEGALPQSSNFWEDFDLPDQPTPPPNFQETSSPFKGSENEGVSQTGKNQNGVKGTSGKPTSSELSSKSTKAQGERGSGESSLYGPAGKIQANMPAQKTKAPGQGVPTEKKAADAKKLPSPFEPGADSSLGMSQQRQPKVRPTEKGEELTLSPVKTSKSSEEKSARQTTEDQDSLEQNLNAPLKAEDREESGDRGKEKRIIEIESPSLPTLSSNVQPMAAAAATQAAPYLTPATTSLFFQMVGTMFMMAGPQGVNRTEIVLNNPAFANSKFFGSTITIEKYATAPDSFNIRLTGSQEAVLSFQENIPSLMTAFQNGNFAFKVNRLDVEYSLERPVFRRRDKEEDKGDAGGGDLGERRK